MNHLGEREILREVVGEIETLRMKRRLTYAHIQHPEHKRFTQEELRDFMPSYKNWTLGLTYHLPSREQILQIADYLECTMAERNDLLLAAHYLPERFEFRDDQYQIALDQARTLMYLLPFPALLVARHWVVESYNDRFQILTDCLPHVQAPGLLWLFDPTFPIRKLLDIEKSTWRDNVSGTIIRFQGHNRIFQREPWYREQVSLARTQRDIDLYWDSLRPEEYTNPTIGNLILYTRFADTPIHLCRVSISAGIAPYPVIHAYLPADDASTHVLANTGVLTSENGWEKVLRSSTDLSSKSLLR